VTSAKRITSCAKKRSGKAWKGSHSSGPIDYLKPPGRPTSGSTASSERTRVNILSAAQRVLATEGYAAFSTRNVATAAGIRPGNLAYHYRTKRDLLHAVITAMVAEYTQKIDAFFLSNSAPHPDGFPKLVTWLIHDATTPYTNAVFRELWAMSLHDPFIAKAVGELYAKTMSRTAELLQVSYPNLSASRANDIVCFLATISEGTGVIYGLGTVKASAVTAVTILAIESLVRAARDSTEM
jgi:AcrR family transcriptional regulator